MTRDYLVLFFILIVTMIVTVRVKKLTPGAALAGGFLGWLIYLGAGFTGIAMIAAFFILGTVATSWKRDTKIFLGIAAENEGRRTAGQVFANAGVAGILCACVYLLPEQAPVLRLMMAAGFSAATADTLSSELGNVYGSRFYNIINLKKDQKGLNGVVSIEGSLIGLAGSMVMAVIYSIGFGWNVYFAWIVIAGTIGNLADSVLGATIERRRYLNNNTVNFLNTLIAAATALVFGKFF